MRWYDNGNRSRSSYVSLSGINLYKVNDEIYDEIVKKPDGYYVLKRCDILNYYDPEHTFPVFATNNLSYIIYPLQQEKLIKLDWDLPLTFGDNTQIVVDYDGKAPTIDFSVTVDRRYKEYVDNYDVTELDVSNIEHYDRERPIEVLEIESLQDNIGEPLVDEDGTTKYRVKISLYDEYNSEVTFQHVVVPRQLMTGDKVYFSSYLRRWTLVSGVNQYVLDYMPLKLEFKPVWTNRINKLQIHAGVKMTLAVPKRKVRDLEKPKNLKSIIEDGTCTITWDMVSGAETYMLFKGGEYFETVTEPIYSTMEELKGYITIKALNTLGKQSPLSDAIYVHSVPNNPFIIFIDNIWKNNKYYITVFFQDNSQLEEHYRIRYKVDDRDELYVEVPGSDKNGTILQHTLEIPYIMNQILIRVTSVNEQGENVVAPYEKLLMPIPKYKWGYNVITNQIVLSWEHIYSDATHYNIRYKVQGEEEYKSVEAPCQATGVGQSVTAFVPCPPDKTVEVSIAGVIDETLQIYTNPQILSKAKDPNCVAPSNFRYVINDNQVTFYWRDDYKVEDNFQFVYSFANGDTQTVYINSDSVEQTGKEYSYTYTFEEHGFISAKVRMGWALTDSAFTEEVLIYYLPVSGLPPAYLYRYRKGDNTIHITWEGQLYVEHYKLHIVRNGEVEVIECVDNNYYLEHDYSGVDYEVYIITRFLGEIETEPSESLHFRPVLNSSNDVNTFVYTAYDESIPLASSVVTPSVSKFRCGEAITTTVSSYVDYRQTFIDQYRLFKWDLYTNIWGVKIPTFNYLETKVYKPDLLQNIIRLNTTVFVEAETKVTKGTTIYSPQKITHTMFMEINKVRIATLGDSITAGHPGFWAESMTGDVTSQYQYWLQRRVGDNFEVINKGYGRDTSNHLVQRFAKDLLPLNAQFCIIQIGTNDIFEAQKAGKDDQKVLDSYTEALRANMVTMINICLDNNIIPIVGNLIPRTGFKGMYREALWQHNKWLEEYCTTNPGIEFVNFYDAGKQNIPPTPLEDPNEPGAMDERYDGDTVYDEYGNVVSRGNGIHPNVAGYRLMGEAVPLSIFKDTDSGLKLYVDPECTHEENVADSGSLNTVYSINIPNIIRGKKKFTSRYIKNTGNDRLLFAVFPMTVEGLKVTLRLANAEDEVETASGLLIPKGVNKLDIYVDVPLIGETPKLNLGLASRPIL